MHTHTCIHTYVYICIHMHIYIYIDTNLYIFNIYTQMYIYIYIYAQMYIYIFKYIYIYMHIYTYLHIYIYIYIYIYCVQLRVGKKVILQGMVFRNARFCLKQRQERGGISFRSQTKKKWIFAGRNFMKPCQKQLRKNHFKFKSASSLGLGHHSDRMSARAYGKGCAWQSDLTCSVFDVSG